MGRIPCCEKDNVKKGQWTPEEDNKLSSYIAQHGTRNWRLIPKNAGLQRCGKSCRLRWTNYLRPDLKHGQFSEAEEQTIVKLHSVVGNRWSLIAAQLPGRTDNDVKNHWNTKLKKKLSGMGIDPITHKPFSHLMAQIATTLEPPQVAHLAEAALGCFKDEMLHLLTKKRINFQLQQCGNGGAPAYGGPTAMAATDHQDDDDTIEKIKMGLSRAMMQEPNMVISNKTSDWDSIGETSNGGCVGGFHGASVSRFQYGFGNEGDGSLSPWNQSVCTGSTGGGGGGGGGDHHQQGRFSERIDHHHHHHHKDENGDDDESDQGGKGAKSGPSLFNSECVLWDIPSDDLMMNPMV